MSPLHSDAASRLAVQGTVFGGAAWTGTFTAASVTELATAATSRLLTKTKRNVLLLQEFWRKKWSIQDYIWMKYQ